MPQAKFTPTDEDRQKVELLAAVGTKQELIAKMIKGPKGKPISKKTLERHFAEELELGLTNANSIVGQTAFTMATSGLHPAMTMFWLKCRAHWKEVNVQQNQTLDANGNPITPTPPQFGISFVDGGPGNPVDNSGVEVSGDVELSSDKEPDEPTAH